MNDMQSEQAASPWRSFGRFFWELIKVFLISLAIIVPVRYFLVQPFFVRGASMEPNFHDEEYLVIDQFSYRFLREPARGEVIVFRFPKQPSQFFIKRIVGLPGERVRIDGGQVVVHNDTHPQGVILDESAYLPSEVRTGGVVDTQLGKDEFFVLGDNRAASSDSRSWGALPEFDIIGRAWIRAFPFDQLRIFEYTRPGFISL